MKISDEIRKWCDNADVDGDACGELRDLADRIDSEMVELPRDREGKPIHVGDTVYDQDGRAWHVRGVTIGENQFLWEEYDVHATSDTDVWRNFISNSLTHKRPDSWERIADELEEWSEDNRVNGDSEVFDRAADFADRIRKLSAKEDEHEQD